ncbi:TonB-dependent receptor [uncultured Sphingomonas sp.]|uniref:TonB-dependent receptor n=1 Tax=uncultured Sphingomonas sp. TaxID=158754 RepID=UPI0025D87B0D|nr:TonB-dependent receptor [uncultured Sphingomonas sp.]
MKAWVLLAGASLVAVSGSAQAQTTAQAESATSQDATADDPASDIIVTAQRRNERLRDVPIAITVVDGASIRETGANQLADITQRAPSLNFTATPGVPNFAIRGVGTNSFDYGIESAVGIAVDDVNITLPRFVPLNSLADVERVEVLRGPQGLLFGKNTTAGLISITTARPELGKFGSSGRVQVGERDQVQSQAVVNLPIGQTAALRVVGGYQYQKPVTELVGPGKLDPVRRWFGTAKLLWEPTDRLSLYAIADYQNNSGIEAYSTIRKFGGNDPTPIPAALRPLAPANFVIVQNTALGVTASPRNNRTAIGSNDVLRNERSSGAQFTASYDAGPVAITSVTAYRDLNARANNDVDQTPIPFFDTNIANSQSHQFSQELRINNTGRGVVDYTAGLYYFRQHIDAQIQQSGTFGVFPASTPIRLSPVNGQSNFDYTTKSYAAFAQLTFNVTQQLRLIAGGRYTRDEIESTTTVTAVPGVCNLVTFLLSGGRTCVGALAAPVVADRGANGFSGRAGVEYALGTANLYATYTRGYKGPAISSAAGVAFAVDPERVDAYEVGVKADLLDRRLTLNLAGFINDFRDFQAQVFDPTLNGGLGTFRTGNASTLKTRGVEAEAIVRPASGFSLTGGVTYLDTEYGNYNVACYFGQTAAQGCSLPGPSFNAAGSPLVGASKWTTSLAASVDRPVDDALRVFANADWRYRSSFYYAINDPNTIQPGFSVVNATVGIGNAEGRARFSVFVRNLFDKRYAAAIFPGNFSAGQYVQSLPDNAFRRIGAAFEWRF